MKTAVLFFGFVFMSVSAMASFPVGTFECKDSNGYKDVYTITKTNFSIKGGKSLELPFLEVTSDFEKRSEKYPFKIERHHETMSGIASIKNYTNGNVELTIPGSNIVNRDRNTNSMSLMFNVKGNPVCNFN